MPRLPRKTKVDVRLCHACHVKHTSMSPCATPATQSAAASRAPKTRPSAPPSAMSATPATQNEGGCEIVPRLPRETHVDVTKCHAVPRLPRKVPRLPRKVPRRHGRLKPAQSAPPGVISARPATQNEGGCEIVPRLPRETHVDVTKCHACHAKCRGVTGA